MPKGICNLHVIMRTLEELLSNREIYTLASIRCQQSLKIDLSTKSSLPQSLKSIQSMKPHLDKLPNLKSAYIESLVYEYITSADKNLNLLHIALELGNGSASCYDIANC
jgi:hypothetical protein